MTLSILSGAVASALSGVFSLAQVFHIVRKRSAAGLSDVAWLLLGDPYLIATNTASLAGNSSTRPAAPTRWSSIVSPVPGGTGLAAALISSTAGRGEPTRARTGALRLRGATG